MNIINSISKARNPRDANLETYYFVRIAMALYRQTEGIVTSYLKSKQFLRFVEAMEYITMCSLSHQKCIYKNLNSRKSE